MSEKKIQLDGPDTWSSWYAQLKKSCAGSTDIWGYVNPEANITKEVPSDPEEPELIHYYVPIAGATAPDPLRPSHLDERQYRNYIDEIRIHREKSAKNALIREKIVVLQTWIYSTISNTNRKYIESLDSIHEAVKLLKLKNESSIRSQQLKVRAEYKKVQKYDNKESLTRWMERYEFIHTEAKRLKLIEILLDDGCLDFLVALSDYDENLSTSLTLDINRRVKASEDVSLSELISTVKDHIDIHKSKKQGQQYSNSSFGTSYKGVEENKKGDRRRKPTCMCGKEHYYGDCLYINKDLNRPEDWKADLEIVKKIEERMKTDTKFKEFCVKSIDITNQRKKRKEEAEKKKNSQSTSATTTTFATHMAMTSHLSAAGNRGGGLLRCWTLDNASDLHISNTREGFNLTRKIDNEALRAGGHIYPIEARGTCDISINTPEGEKTVTLKNVALIPSFLTSIISLGRCMEAGVHWNSRKPQELEKDHKTFAYLQYLEDHWVVQHRDQVLQASNISSSYAVKRTEQPLHREISGELLHKILSHPHQEVIKHVEKAVRDVTVVNPASAPDSIQCSTCATSKATKIISRRTINEEEFKTPGAVWAFDIIHEKVAYNGDKYVSHLQDLHTGFNIIYTHKKKSTSLAVIETAFDGIKNIYGYDAKIIHLDNESTLKEKFKALLSKRGIRQKRTAPDTPEQSKSERAGRLLTEKARSMMVEAGLPDELWNEAYMAAGYTGNRTPTKRFDWKTPFEMFTRSKPGLAHMHPFGCRAYVVQHKIPKLEKMQPRAVLGYLVGYDSTNIFRVWMPSKERVIRTRDVRFDDYGMYDPHEVEVGNLKEAEEVIDAVIIPTDVVSNMNKWKKEIEQGLEISRIGIQYPNLNSDDEHKQPTPKEDPQPSEHQTEPQEPAPTPSSRQEGSSTKASALKKAKASATRAEEISADFNEDNIIDGKRTRKEKKRSYAMALQLVREETEYHASYISALKSDNRTHISQLPPEPKSWQQMLKHPKKEEFIAGCNREIKELYGKNTFESIDTNEEDESNYLPLKWVFKYKTDLDGYITKYKSRLVARGDLHADESMTYAATVAIQVFRAMMAVSARHKLKVRAYDVKNAYLNARLASRIRCQHPPGYFKKGKALYLLMALYGLPHSGNLWYEELKKELIKLGLFQVPGVSCLFTNEWLTVLFYVDDIVTIYFEKDQDKYDSFEKELMNTYEITKLGDILNFLGIRVVRNEEEGTICLVQDAYIEKLIEKFDITGTEKTPLPARKLNTYLQQATMKEIRTYQQKVGSVNYAATNTRPDISRAVSKLSEFNQNPGPEHMEAIDHLLKYLNGTKYHGIEYNGEGTHLLRSFHISSDASYADNVDRKSSAGYCFMLFGGVIHYKATKQRTVTTSTTEAELLGVSHTAKELMWWIRLFKGINFDLDEQQLVYCDNTQTIRALTMEEDKLFTKLKHIDIHSHWLRQEIEAGVVTIEYLESSQLVADGFTKELTRQKHENFMKLLRLKDLSNTIEKEGKKERTQRYGTGDQTEEEERNDSAESTEEEEKDKIQKDKITRSSVT